MTSNKRHEADVQLLDFSDPRQQIKQVREGLGSAERTTFIEDVVEGIETEFRLLPELGGQRGRSDLGEAVEADVNEFELAEIGEGKEDLKEQSRVIGEGFTPPKTYLVTLVTLGKDESKLLDE